MKKYLLLTVLLFAAFSAFGQIHSLGADVNINFQSESQNNSSAVESTFSLSPFVVLPLENSLNLEPFVVLNYYNESNPDNIPVGIRQDFSQFSLGLGARLSQFFYENALLALSIGSAVRLYFPMTPGGDSANTYDSYFEFNFRASAFLRLDINLPHNFVLRVSHDLAAFYVEGQSSSIAGSGLTTGTGNSGFENFVNGFSPSFGFCYKLK